MQNIILKIYDYLRTHRVLRVCLMVITLLFLIFRTLTLSYKEDISEFLPTDATNKKSLEVYQNISSTDRIFVVFRMKNDSINQSYIVNAIDLFSELLLRTDSLHYIKSLTTEIDYEQILEQTADMYNFIPYLLTEEDYKRIDTMVTPEYIQHQIQQDKLLLMLPTGSLLSKNIRKDPLNIFTPVVSRLQNSQNTLNYDLYDGHIFSPNKTLAFAIINSPFGSNETSQNATLIKIINSTIRLVEAQLHDVDIHITGAPVIAVGNAERIKKDSIIAVSLAIILILALLFYSFRSISNILFIVLSIVWGALFATAGISFFHSNISIIVLGISSVIIGISVNYPLHLMAHLKHALTIRDTLKEIVTPLLIGNVTTVGAFLCLVPLQAPALQDLGIFGAFMLIGTILFVLIFLPHIVRNRELQTYEPQITEKLSSFSPESNRWTLPIVIVVSAVLGYFSLHTTFDSDIRNINYMTAEQKSDFIYLQDILNDADDNIALYVISDDKNIDGALHKSEQLQSQLDKLIKDGIVNSKRGITQFAVSKQEQSHRIKLWNKFLSEKKNLLDDTLNRELSKNGFNADAFSDFQQIIQKTYEVNNSITELSPILASLSSEYISENAEGCSVIDIISVPKGNIAKVKSSLKNTFPSAFNFTIEEMNNSMTNTLSNEFNYIGFSCAFIVFVFLWLSFGRLELSLLAFLPMMISWIWILGLMGIFDIKFNIVNIILATFIFGQGDDYTIFITEGLIYEYAYKKKMLASFKNSIILSALIMFIGIGTLIVSEHPALLSLAQVTIVGMFSVVFMAYLLPPLIFKLLTISDNRPRRIPITIDRVVVTVYSTIGYFVELLIGYLLGIILFSIGKKSPKKVEFFHRYIHFVSNLNMKCISGVKYNVYNPYGETFTTGAIVICNHQSILDSILMMSLSPKVRIVVNSKAYHNPLIHKLLQYADFYTTESDIDALKDNLCSCIHNGCLVVIFPEGARSKDSSIQRFHKGAFYLAQSLSTDILPVIIHGVGDVMPKDGAIVNKGRIDIEIGKRLEISGKTYQEQAKNFEKHYKEWYEVISLNYRTADYYRNFVLSRYLYKGIELERNSKKLLNKYNCFCKWIDVPITSNNIVIINNGNGELGLLFALVHKTKNIYAFERSEDKLLVSRNCDYLPSNLYIEDIKKLQRDTLNETAVYILEPTSKEREQYMAYNPIIIEC